MRHALTLLLCTSSLLYAQTSPAINDPGAPPAAPSSAAPSAATSSAAANPAAASASPNPAATGAPVSAKAQKAFAEGQSMARHNGQQHFAIDAFKKAAKEDGGSCAECDRQIIKLALDTADIKAGVSAGQEWIAHAQRPKDQSEAHYRLGLVYLLQGRRDHKSDAFAASEHEFKSAIDLDPGNKQALYTDGLALAYLQQDDAARARFQEYLKFTSATSTAHQRVVRFIERPELARARMAPPFAVTTLDGKRVSLDDFAGKVVLIDFWATWCGPCREALPQIRRIAHDFSGQPLVILSISLDKDQQKWQDFVHKNDMTWLQYRDGGWDGDLAQTFDVKAIPHTFTIDADGVLQDEHIGEASIDGKLKKLCAQAKQLEAQRSQQASTHSPQATPPTALQSQ